MEHINNLENILQQYFQWNKARIKFITLFILSLIKVRTVCLTDISISLNKDAKPNSNYRRIQNFFFNFLIDYTQIGKFIISQLPRDRKYILTLDRTNWQFGKTDINILMLGIVYRKTTIPLIWEMLDKKGNSSADERIEIISKAIKLLGKDRIKSIVADREFGSIQWLKYLNNEGLEYHIRIRKDAVIQKYLSSVKQVKDLFKNVRNYNYIIIPHKKIIYKQEVYISGNRTKSGEYFILISNKNPKEALKDYRQRWTIENLFGYLKTKGFNFEDTHLKDPEKIKKLLVLMAIAFTWSYKVGVWLDESIKIKIKNHGRKEISLFRKGYDYLRHVVQFVDYKVEQFNILVNFLSCT